MTESETQESPKQKQKRIAWTKMEDNTLMQVIKEKWCDPTTNLPWPTIIPEFNARMKICDHNYKERVYRNIIEHYNQKLDPNIKNQNFTPEECERIVRLKNQGMSWPNIKKEFPSHSLSHIKNKYNSLKKQQNSPTEPEAIEEIHFDTFISDCDFDTFSNDFDLQNPIF